jgi:hypothetical protein
MVGGNPQGLSRVLTDLGFRSESWALQQSSFGYLADKVIWSERDGLIIQELKRIAALTYVFRFDAVCFNFGSGLFPHRQVVTHHKNKPVPVWIRRLFRIYIKIMARLEMALLRLRRIPMFIFYQGSDARQGDFCIKNFEITYASRVGEETFNLTKDRATRDSIRFYSGYAKKIYALNPDLLHVLPTSAEFLPYSHIDLGEWRPVSKVRTSDETLRVGHAPSNRAIKGTDIVCRVVEKLQRNGYPVELILIEGITNEQAKRCYEAVDIFVDQLFVGWYGGLAVEAMALGKPVIAYIRDEDLRFLSSEMAEELPIIRATPDTIQSVLKSVLAMPRPELLKLAKCSRAYVERWHDPVVIAERIKEDIEEVLNER